MQRQMKQLLIMLLASALWLSNQVQAEELEGVIRGLDLDRGKISLEENTFQLAPKLNILNLAGGSSNPSALAVKQHVRARINQDGEVTDIRIFPSNPEKRWRLGYRPQERQQ